MLAFKFQNLQPATLAVLALLVAAPSLTACGTEVTTPKRKKTGTTASEPLPGYTSPIAPQPGVPGQAGDATQTLAAFGQAWSAVRTLSAKYDLREEKGREVETAKVTFYLKKPSKYRYEVASHSASIKNGSTSVFDTRSRQITSRLGGALSLIPIKGTLDDSRSKSVRGWTLDQTDYATQVEMFLAPGAPVTAGTPGTGPVLELANPVRYNGSIQVMRATLDPVKMVPTSIEMYAAGKLVYRKRFSALQLNPSVGADKFSL